MEIKTGINGFGRIARIIVRSLTMRETDVNLIAINVHHADHNKMAYQLKYDSVFGRFNGTVEATEDGIRVNGKDIKVFSEDNPEDIPWASVGIEYVIESTGIFTKLEDCKRHMQGGAKKVVLTAPGKGDGFPMFVMGVNHETYDPATMDVISNASCTTNCLAPLAKVINDKFGIKRALMSTIHASTSKQKAVDANAGKDLRIGRSVYDNIIPSSTGAAKAVGSVIPELKGKMTGCSFRIPAPDVSVVDLTAELEKETTYEEICAAVKEASETYMKGIIEYNEDAIVSCDMRGDFNTCIFDVQAGIQLDPTFVKLVAWYDNEWGYSNKVLDLLIHMAHADAAAK